MRRRHILILIIVIIFSSILCFKLFYKTIDGALVPADTDAVIAINVKRLMASAFWNTFTHPGQWTFSPRRQKGVDWKQLVEIPDFIFVSHITGTSYTNWYTVFDLNKPALFSEEIEKIAVYDTLVDQEFRVSKMKDLPILVLQYRNKIIIAARENTPHLIQVAKELFIAGRHAEETALGAIITSHHISGSFIGSGKSKKISCVADFNSDGVNFSGDIDLNLDIDEQTFQFNSFAVASAGFSHTAGMREFIGSDSTKQQIGRVLNFDFDSLFLDSNTSYSFDFFGAQTRVDTAISYSYDDNFEPIESKIFNKVSEPAFRFSIKGTKLKLIYDHWKNRGLIRNETGSEQFTGIPFAKTFVQLSDQELTLFSAPLDMAITSEKRSGIFFFNADFNRLPAAYLKLLPDNVSSIVTKISSFEVEAKKAGTGYVLTGSLKKKWPSKPLLAW